MAFEKFFTAANLAGIAPFELRSSVNSKLSVGVFQDEIEEYTIADDCTLAGRGNINGKCGMFSSDKSDESVIPVMMNAIKESAEFGEPYSEELYFGGGAKYEKLNLYNETLDERCGEVVAVCKKISELCRKNENVSVCQVKAQYIANKRTLANSNGLDISSRANYLLIYSILQINVGDEVQSSFHYAFVTDMDKFDVDAFSAEAVKRGLDKIGAQPIASGTYDMIFHPEVVSSLCGALSEHFSAFEASKHLSVLEGKVGQKIASEHITIEEKPLTENPHGSIFDDEGVPCQNKMLIEKGVLKTLVHSLETAKAEGVESTGNGSFQGTNIRPALGFTVFHSEGKSFDELLAELGNGVYITSVEGEGTGLNSSTLDYSLQASGFVVENGKIASPVNLVTIASNVLSDLANVTAVGGESVLTLAGFETPSLLVKGVALSGK